MGRVLGMTLYDVLLDKYGYNEPILTSEIQFNNYSKPWIYKELNRLCKTEKIIRFEKGVYYIPKKSPLGMSLLNPNKVVEKKYIKEKEKIYGYYAGYYLLNQLGLSTQVPNIIEIYSNNESSKVRDIKVGSQNVRVRKPRVAITTENAPVLTLLELMNVIDFRSLDDVKKNIIIKYIVDYNISKKDITKYSPEYPDRVIRAMVESEVIYSVAQ